MALTRRSERDLSEEGGRKKCPKQRLIKRGRLGARKLLLIIPLLLRRGSIDWIHNDSSIRFEDAHEISTMIRTNK